MAEYGTGHEWVNAIGTALAANVTIAAIWDVVKHNNAITSPPSGPTVYCEWERSMSGAMADEDTAGCAHVAVLFLVWPHGTEPSDPLAIRDRCSYWGQVMLETLRSAPGVPAPQEFDMQYEAMTTVNTQQCAVLEIRITTQVYI